MTVQLIVFSLSLLIFFGFIYMTTSLWFRGKRTRMLVVFSLLGLLCSLWVLFNGINILLSPELYVIIYPIMPQALINPTTVVLTIYILHFIGSKLAHNKLVLRVLISSAIADLLLLLTNPLHKELIIGYDGLIPLTGRLFTLHVIITYIPVLLAAVALYRYVFRNIRQKPFLGIVGVGVALPLVLSTLFSFQFVSIEFDLSPFAFIIMYGSFAFYSIRMRLFDIKETAAEVIFETLSEALIVVDRAGLVVNANPAFRKSFPEIPITTDETPIREVAAHLKSISTKLASPELIEKIFSDEPEDISGAEITVSNGKMLNYTLSKDIISERGYHMGYIVTLADISNYRQMIDIVTELKTQADSASSAKGLFLSHMSHEIRTPLNAIIGMINIGLNSGDVEKKNYCFARADNASKHLLGLINDILDISKIEADRFELSFGVLNLEKMLNNIVNVANVRAEEKRQELIINLGGDVPACIEGDELRLSQVITNLLTNAIKFTPEKGAIVLDIKKIAETDSDVELRVEVADNGIGIPEEQQKKLFSSFIQADASIAKRFGGTGLGLSISKRIVELMGGRIWVESELGKGSRFIFTIKATKLTDDICEAPGDVQIDTSRRHYDFCLHTILIAEDVEINWEIMSAILEETNVTIEFAGNGKEAVDMFSRNPGKYSLILMDVNMPEMDGYEATRAIRSIGSEAAKAIPIIAMTANVFKEDIEKCLESGMNDHTGKPIDTNALFGLLRNYMSRPGGGRKMKNVHNLVYGIAWDDSLLTGNALVDMQHQKLFERLSDIVDSCEAGGDIAQLYDTLMFLLNRTIRHFVDEEALLLEYDYPDYENHRQKHEEFRKTVAKLVQRYEDKGSSKQLSNDVNRVIVRWLVNHIQLEDKRMSEYIKNEKIRRINRYL